MQAIRRRVFKSLFAASSSCSSYSLGAFRTLHIASQHSAGTPDRLFPLRFLITPWSAVQNRGAKVLGTDVRPGNVVQRKDRIYQVLKAQHTQHGRGGATIQVELRDVDSGNKITERFRTDEAIERVFVEEKSFTFLYTEGHSVMLMEPKTFEQIEVDKDLFGKAAAYLTDDMKVSLQFYDGKPMSASVPSRVTCTVAEAQDPMKGITATPQYKKVLLDNGLTVLVPAFIRSGDQIVINTIEDTYITRAKE
ncbi:elongation factor P isoform X2 [Telopea speciosissima]|uniref:elongation factor P isoform X1 n=1 Tax=Telopea speciosissima TaxID=54955 RepID=UPI001CC544F7|nr:elongation factor P isoform X1 [Telopea speciosissima]XP_043693420.1 elongation factor P isoform X2 [Telopea speciosissima]